MIDLRQIEKEFEAIVPEIKLMPGQSMNYAQAMQIILKELKRLKEIEAKYEALKQ